MKTTKEKIGFIYHIPEDSSDEVVAEMKSRMEILTRNQLEMLIFVLSQEIRRLKLQLEPHSSASLDPLLKIAKSGCQDGNKESTETNCAACQRNRSITHLSQFPALSSLRSLLDTDTDKFEKGNGQLKVPSTTLFPTLELGETTQQEELVKIAQFFIYGVCEKDINSNNQIVSEEFHRKGTRNNIDAQLTYPLNSQVASKMDQLTFVDMSGHNDNPVKEIEGMEFQEDQLPSKARKATRDKEKRDARSSCEKQCLHLCASRKDNSKSPQSQMKDVEVEHPQPVIAVGNNSKKIIQSNDAKHRQKKSLQDNADTGLLSCLSAPAKSDKAQHSYKNKQGQISNPSSFIDIPRLEIAAENRDVLSCYREVLSCCLCKADFQSKLMLTLHMKTEHKTQQHSCLICGKFFAYKHNLKVHQRNRHNRSTVLCSYCGKLVLQARLETHMEKVHEKPMFTCHICQKGFLKRECLEGHINKHSNTKPYICECCGRKYAYSTSLSSHKKLCSRASMPAHLFPPRSLDNKSSSFICEICGVKFEGLSGLKDHTSAKHSNKSQVCSFCGKGFQWRPSYNRHIKKCKDRSDLERDRCKQLLCQKSVRKQFVCVCGKQYLYRQSYRRHEKGCKQKQEIETYMTDSTV